jgi:hypothetical protein
MGTLFALLFGMLVGGAGIALGIMAYDRSRGRQDLATQCSAEE